jgi:hypothetical protein
VPQLAFDLGDLANRAPGIGRRLRTCQVMVEHLQATGRLDVVHLPIVEHLYGLCEALESAGGRGASYALLSAQFDKAWERLASLPLPEPDDDDDLDFDVSLLPPAHPDHVDAAG